MLCFYMIRKFCMFIISGCFVWVFGRGFYFIVNLFFELGIYVLLMDLDDEM